MTGIIRAAHPPAHKRAYNALDRAVSYIVRTKPLWRISDYESAREKNEGVNAQTTLTEASLLSAEAQQCVSGVHNGRVEANVAFAFLLGFICACRLA